MTSVETTAAPTPCPDRAPREPRPPRDDRPHPPRRRYARGRRAAAVAGAVGLTGVLLAGCATGTTTDGPSPSKAALPVHASGVGPDPATTPATHAEPPAKPHDASGTKGLDPELQRRFDAARAAAAKSGLSLTITSGRRTVAQQKALIDEAVAEHGSVAEAHKFVLPPGRSAHVTGTAIDVGGQKAAAWLAEHETTFGLCRTYANEWWHFELVGAIGETCPAMHPDSSGGWDGADAG